MKTTFEKELESKNLVILKICNFKNASGKSYSQVALTRLNNSTDYCIAYKYCTMNKINYLYIDENYKEALKEYIEAIV